MKSPSLLLTLLTALLVLPLTGIGQTCPGSPGCVDETFGIGGMNIVSPPAIPLGGYGYGSVMQSDGKIVALISVASSEYRNALVRFTADGQIDTAFGDGGFAYVTWSTPNPGAVFNIEKQIVNSEERFVLIGGGGNCTGNPLTCARMERWTNAGLRDTSFGSNGVVSFAVSISNAICWGSGMQSDQKIVTSCGSGTSSTVFRFNANGSADNTFGKKGVSQANTGIIFRRFQALSSGKILGVGNYSGDAAVARFNSNGTLDTSFGIAGKRVVDIAGNQDFFIDLAIDASGRIVVSGEAMIGGSTPSYYDALLMRFTSNGTTDTSFGTGGKTLFNNGGGQDEFGQVAIQPDGKIVVAGESRIPGNRADWIVARFDTNGALDPGFASTGWLLKEFYGAYDFANGVMLQADSGCGGCLKLVVTGGVFTGTLSTDPKFTAAVRFLL